MVGEMSAVWSALMVIALLAGHGESREAPAETTERDFSASVGHPFTGRLLGGVKLAARGPNYRLRGTTVAHRWNFGVEDLIRGIRHTAIDVENHVGGADLVVGNLSRKRGGDLPCSRSHNTGRDVDFGLYMVDSRGRSVPSRYYRFGKDGRSLEAGGRYRFDVERNWALIESLLRNPHFHVQWLVLNPHLERLVLEHARSKGVAPELVRRAAKVIDLPRYANLHRNHLHVRILCPQGHARCEQGGPVWPWVPRRLAAR
jgi:penicillin-insensitive murein DD-endopeptidase